LSLVGAVVLMNNKMGVVLGADEQQINGDLAVQLE
jgi:hypothetical protein